MNIGHSYYLLALYSAKKRDLSRAVELARYAICFGEDEKASRLLELCLYELGTREDLSCVRDCKKWRKAEKAARSLEHQSVRVLIIRGCLYASVKRYGKAAKLFAMALEKDSGNALARDYLTETVKRQKGLCL